MSESICVREYDIESDLKPWLDLHEAAYGPDEEEHLALRLRWFDANPLGGNLYLAAYSGEKLVGFLAFVGQTIGGMGREFRAALAVSAMSHPGYRGRGIYASMLHKGFELAAERGIDFCLGYTVRDYVLALELKIGWEKISEGHVLALPLDFPAIARQLLPRAAAVTGLFKPLDYLQRARVARRLARTQTDNLEFRKISAFGRVYDELAAETTKESVFGFVKTAAFLGWKYAHPDNPYRYDLVEVLQDGRVLGCLVGRLMNLKGLNGYSIVDVIVSPRAQVAVVPLIAKALEAYALPRDPEVVACMVSPGTAVHSALRRFSFHPLKKQTFSLIYHATAAGLPDALATAKWANCWGNNDTV